MHLENKINLAYREKVRQKSSQKLMKVLLIITPVIKYVNLQYVSLEFYQASVFVLDC